MSVPAGWYPDPLGLPQLRWWDGQQWSEFTSERPAPAAQTDDSATIALADDPLNEFRADADIDRSPGVPDVSPVIVPAEVAAPPAPSAPGGFALDPGIGTLPLPPVLGEGLPTIVDGVPQTTMNAPDVIGYDDDGREFVEKVDLPIITTPGAAPVPGQPGAPAPVPPMPPQSPSAVPVPVPAVAPESLPAPPTASVPGPGFPVVAVAPPEQVGPFVPVPASPPSDPEPDVESTIGSRRARREYQRQQ